MDQVLSCKYNSIILCCDEIADEILFCSVPSLLERKKSKPYHNIAILVFVMSVEADENDGWNVVSVPRKKKKRSNHYPSETIKNV